MIPDQKRIGKRVRAVRQNASLSQEEFGERIDLSKNHISDIERGISLPTVKCLLSIYTNFKVSPDEILLGAQTPELDALTAKITQLTSVGLRLIDKNVDNLLNEGL